jgi:hypothetical protein
MLAQTGLKFGRRQQDHHYISQALQTPSKTFSSRIQKEYQVLQESLPGASSLRRPCEETVLIFW